MTDKTREELILEHLPLVRRKGNFLAGNRPVEMTADELRSCGMVGLIYAVDHHDRAKGSLRAYAIVSIESAMRDGIRSVRGRAGSKACEGYNLTDQLDSDMEWASHLRSEKPLPDCLAMDNFEAGLAYLPPRHREVLRLYYFEDLTMLEIGRQMGVKESRVSQIHKAALKRLRERVFTGTSTRHKRPSAAAA